MAHTENPAAELDFMTAAGLLESGPDEKRKTCPRTCMTCWIKQGSLHHHHRGNGGTQKEKGRDSAANILRILKATLKNTQKFTDDQELYLKKVLTQLEEGGLPKQTAKTP